MPLPPEEAPAAGAASIGEKLRRRALLSSHSRGEAFADALARKDGDDRSGLTPTQEVPAWRMHGTVQLRRIAISLYWADV